MPHKALEEISQTRFMPPAIRGVDLRVASSLGMDEDTRAALKRIGTLAETRRVGIPGRFMPDAGVSAQLAAMGVDEKVEEADFFRFRSLVIPYSGLPAKQRRDFEQAGHRFEDLTSPAVKRALASIALLKGGGARILVIGRHNDPESRTLAGACEGTRIIEETTDTSRLEFAPAFGAVCQTTLSPRRVHWLSQQLRMRWHDARVSFLNTVSPAMAAREKALETVLTTCDRVVIVGENGESSTAALAEAALRHGKPAQIVSTPEELDRAAFTPNGRIALTAGAFATDAAIRAVAEAVLQK